MEKQQTKQESQTKQSHDVSNKSFFARNKGKIIGGAIAVIAIGIIGLIALVGIGFGAWWAYNHYFADNDATEIVVDDEYFDDEYSDEYYNSETEDIEEYNNPEEYIEVEEEDGVAVEEEVIKEEPESAPTEKAVATDKEDEMEIFINRDYQPEYSRGPSELMSFIKRNLRYPDKAREKGVEGICVVEFAVNQDGSISDFKVIKSLDPDCDQEALRIVKAIPNKWEPGRMYGKIIKSKYSVPIAFRLPEDTPPATTEKPAITEQDEEDKIYDVAESMPEYPGGMGALLQYISRNIKYPAQARENGVQGTCIIQIVIEKDGSVSNAKVTKSVDPACDQEALRVVNSLTNWKPATNYGKTVRVRYTIPITFRLN